MRRINCYIPIKISICGRLSEGQLDGLADTLRRTLAARLLFIERTIQSRHSKISQVEQTRELVEESRLQGEGYEVPAYDSMGNKKKVQVRKDKGRQIPKLRMKGPDTEVNAIKFLLQVIERFPRFREGTVGRIKGNTFEFGNKRYQMWPISQEGDEEKISTKLGEGVFFLQPLPTKSVDPIRRLAGPGYKISMVDPWGKLHSTGVQAVIQGFVSIEEGILIYTTPTMYLPEIAVEARPPRDTEGLAKRVIEILGDWGYLLSPAVTIIFVINAIKDENLTNAEMMEVLGLLKRAGRLEDFLSLIQWDEFRQFLKSKGVPWDYIFQNWEPGFNDRALIFMGVMFGAGESVVDVLKLVGILIGGIFSEELAKKRNEFYLGLKKFFKHPIVSSIEGGKHLYHTFMEKLWNLEFFEAGRIVGNVAVFVLTLPSAVKALPKAGAALARAAVKFVRLSAAELRALGLTAENLRDFLRQPGYMTAATPQGPMILMSTGEEVNLLSQTGRPLGSISKGDINKFISEMGKLEEQGPKIPVPGPTLQAPKKLAQLTANDLLAVGITGENLQAFGLATSRRLKTPNASLILLADAVNVYQGEKFIGQFPSGKIGNYLRELKKLEKQPKPPVKKAQMPKGPVPQSFAGQLEQVVKQAMIDLKKQGVKGLSASKYGTRLHGALEKHLKKFAFPKECKAFIETKVSDIVRLPENLAKQKVADYLREHPAFAEELSIDGKIQLDAKTLGSEIGRLKPDLVVKEPGGSYRVWDLTGQPGVEHWAKTMMYMKILSHGNVLVSFGETHYFGMSLLK